MGQGSREIQDRQKILLQIPPPAIIRGGGLSCRSVYRTADAILGARRRPSHVLLQNRSVLALLLDEKWLAGVLAAGAGRRCLCRAGGLISATSTSVS
jgi:hypothetical protein